MLHPSSSPPPWGHKASSRLWCHSRKKALAGSAAGVWEASFCTVAPAFWTFLSFRFWISQIEMVREDSSTWQPSHRGYSASGLLMPPWAVCTSLGCPSCFLALCLHAHLTLIAPVCELTFPVREGVVASACQGQSLKARRRAGWLHVRVKGWMEGGGLKDNLPNGLMGEWTNWWVADWEDRWINRWEDRCAWTDGWIDTWEWMD